MVDAGDHQIRFFLENDLLAQFYAIHRRPVAGVFLVAFRILYQMQPERVPDRYGMPGSGHGLIRRYHHDIPQCLGRGPMGDLVQRAVSLRGVEQIGREDDQDDLQDGERDPDQHAELGEVGPPEDAGARGLRESDIRKRQPLPRELMGRTFNVIVRSLLLGGYRDTQCGFKLFTRDAAQELFGQQILTYIAFLFVPLVFYFLYKTKYGLILRCTGENPAAVDMKGVNIIAYRYWATIFGSMMAGVVARSQ